MNIRTFPRYWYHRKILKAPVEKSDDMDPKIQDINPKIGKADPGPTKKSKLI